ncbi:mycothiol system anti-sigma-R factor [Streptomyces nanshensis]|uniref:Anti-sigma factor n=1 Tax=Streptomyces nanshensis TaxID=518642 RepID=A0A1E7KS25_9ACTN|nr:mycothiol system anti-sigma-R factor [Streptomyces nanshensis]OEV06752.1 anti-sigma factor [Streptomyces nanshensis]
MSCGDPHETDCSEVLDHLYEYLDREMPDSDCEKFKEHFDECSPCLEKYGLEQEVKKLVKRCCGQDEVPSDLRSKVMGRIELIREAEAAGSAQSGAEFQGEGAGAVPEAGHDQAASRDRSSAQTESSVESAQGRKRFA